jgi:hypothetical protein
MDIANKCQPNGDQKTLSARTMKSRKRGPNSATRVLLIALLLASTIHANAKEAVIFTSPCECEGNHGIARWAAKTDTAEPPSNSREIKPITPAEMFEWKGPGGEIPRRDERIALENQWFAMTGRVERLKVEDDGDLHLELMNVDSKAGTVIVELPLGPAWCEMRKTVFSWTGAKFPISSGKEKTLRLREHPVVTVVGRAFYDVDHATADTLNNRRSYDRGVAIWEIHPVMRLDVGAGAPPSVSAGSASAPSDGPTSQTGSKSGDVVTLIKPVTIQVPYGSTVLPAGTKLPVLSRDAQNVDVRYIDARYSNPISSTDSK